jgi:hypothetical protein
VTNSTPASGRPIIALATSARGPADGYRVKASGSGIAITGNDPRGTLFGAGYLLRHLSVERQVLTVDDNLQVSSAPRYPLRGHQLGYRPKVNAYDGWTPAQFEQYIRDLAVFRNLCGRERANVRAHCASESSLAAFRHYSRRAE